MKFKKYIKLRKYVNDKPTEEYKKGNLVGIVESTDIKACENGQTT